MGRFATAWKAFWAILASDTLASRWQQLELPSADREKSEPPAAPVPEQSPRQEHGDAVYTLTLLQREGRLVDFLQEDIDTFSDAQVGAAVRQIHAKCRETLAKYFGVQPVRPEREGEQVKIEPGFDPRQVRLTGENVGEPPFTGTVRHRGWRAGTICLPERHAELDPSIICPAEVEI